MPRDTAPDIEPGDGFTVRFEPRVDHLAAHVVDGVRSPAVRRGFWTAIAARAHRQGVRRLMVVEALDGDPADEAELVELLPWIASLGVQHVRIAFVIRGDHLLPRLELSEILAREHGFEGRVFVDAAAAELWLRYGAS